MGNKKKIAIFDFCGTIYKYQSADKFADFVAKKSIRNDALQYICSVLVDKPKYSGLVHKKVKLLKIKGATIEKLEHSAVEFVQKVILTDLVEVVVTELDKYIEDPEFDVVIASAGYNFYLSYFCKIKNIPFLTATNIEINNNAATGRMDGLDCFGQQKIVRLKEIIDLGSYDLINSVCFSDSLTDKPIFELVGNKYFVKQSSDKYSIIHIPNEVFTIL